MNSIQYLGHSCFLLDLDGHKVLVDPFISQNPINTSVKIDDINCKHILITHGHSDHVADAEEIGKSNDATIISNWEIVNWYEAKGIKGHPMNTGGKWTFDFGKVKLTEAVHSSSMPDGSYGGTANGFLIKTESLSLYIAGDTALTNNMKLIPQIWPALDLAILPIGDNFTMDYEEAIIASDFINCNKIIGCHFDTFGYIKIDHENVKSAFSKAGKELILLNIGEEISI